MAAVNNNTKEGLQDLLMAMEEHDENAGSYVDVDGLDNQAVSHMISNKCPSIVSAFLLLTEYSLRFCGAKA